MCKQGKMGNELSFVAGPKVRARRCIKELEVAGYELYQDACDCLLKHDAPEAILSAYFRGRADKKSKVIDEKIWQFTELHDAQVLHARLLKLLETLDPEEELRSELLSRRIDSLERRSRSKEEKWQLGHARSSIFDGHEILKDIEDEVAAVG